MMCSIVSADHPASATVADGTSLQPGVVAPSDAISGFNSLITTAVWTDGLSSPGAQTAPRSPPPDEPRALRPVRIIHSLFPHKRPTVFFDYPTYVGACGGEHQTLASDDALSPRGVANTKLTSSVPVRACTRLLRRRREAPDV
jgi:hypothetical protein